VGFCFYEYYLHHIKFYITIFLYKVCVFKTMMKTNMQNTSLEAYFGEIQPTLGSRWRIILDVFRSNPGMDFTNKEILEELRYDDPFIDINSVTPRVYELRGKDKRYPEWQAHPLLIESRTRPCRGTKRNAKAWQLNNK